MLNLTSAPLPPGVSALLQLFEGPLADVRFPDVDGASLLTLAEETDAATSALSAARSNLAQAQAALVAAETALLSAESALVVKAQRALGYARVFAEGDAELSRALGAVELSSSRSATMSNAQTSLAPDTAPKRRGRPRKVPAAPESGPGAEVTSLTRAPLFVLPSQDARAHAEVGNEAQSSASAV